MKTKIFSFISTISLIFLLIPNVSLAVSCYGRYGTYTGESGPDNYCPFGTLQTNTCRVNPTPGCVNYVAPSKVPTPTVNPVLPSVEASSTGAGYNLPSTSNSGAVTNPINEHLGEQTAFTGLIPCDGTKAHPCDFNALAAMINRIINWFIGISVTVATITFSIAGAKMLMNPENEGEREAAKEMFKKTVIGMLIVLVAWLAIHTVISTLVNPDTNALRFFGN